MAELTEKQIEILVKAAETVLGGARVQVYNEIVHSEAASASTHTRDFSLVRPGHLRVITHVAALNASRSSTFIRICHIEGGKTAIDKVGIAPLTGETVNWDSFRILGESDYTRILWLGCTIGDTLWAVVSGYEIID